MKYIVSACLAGVACRYDGKSNSNERVMALVREGKALPVCPEQLGGLSTPRIPCERQQGRVINAQGEDCTLAFQRGVAEAVRLAELAGCTNAILKARSPSCGSGTIYDGTFSKTLIEGDGLFTAELRKRNLIIEHESEE